MKNSGGKRTVWVSNFEDLAPCGVLNLTLKGVIEMEINARSSRGRLSLVMIAVIALVLALFKVPASASAENVNFEPVYDDPGGGIKRKPE